MKKKILLIIMMFMFITNVKALTFNVDVTNIENEGNGTLGEITNIDVSNKEVTAYFQDIGDEVNFSITVTNTGDRAGTLRSITFENENQNMEYTSNLPEGGLAINGNDTNKVIINAKVKQGATILQNTFKYANNEQLKYCIPTSKNGKQMMVRFICERKNNLSQFEKLHVYISETSNTTLLRGNYYVDKYSWKN